MPSPGLVAGWQRAASVRFAERIGIIDIDQRCAVSGAATLIVIFCLIRCGHGVQELGGVLVEGRPPDDRLARLHVENTALAHQIRPSSIAAMVSAPMRRISPVSSSPVRWTRGMVPVMARGLVPDGWGR